MIEEFQYPKYGPGMMWERARDLVLDAGGEIVMNAEVTAIQRDDAGATAVVSTLDGHDDNDTRRPR